MSKPRVEHSRLSRIRRLLISTSRELAHWVGEDDRLFICCLSAVLVALSWFLQSRIDFWMGDEGFLWYGSWRVGHGEVPLRDFYSYDPGRYYWGALWSLLFGDGLLGQRAGVALFQVIGLAWGLFAARRVVRHRLGLFLVGLLLLVWMYPRHKLFECSFAMGAVFVATLVAEKPSSWRLWLSGVFVGVAGFFGRNLGLYTLLAFVAILLMLRLQTRMSLSRVVMLFTLGVLIGYSPIFLLMISSSGFASSFVDSILAILRRGSTDAPLPIPWPWTVKLVGQGWLIYADQVLLGVTYLVLYGFLLLALIAIFFRRRAILEHQPLIVAATFVGLVHAHHASVRADAPHLLQSIHPTLLGLIVLISLCARRGWRAMAFAGATSLAILTILVAAYQQPVVTKMLYPERFDEQTLQGERFWVPTSQAQFLSAVRNRIEPQLGKDDLVFFAPDTPGMYRILGRRSPVWDIFPIEFGGYSAEQQQRMIDELVEAKIKYAIVDDAALDGQDERRFRHTHPWVWTYLLENYSNVEDRSFPTGYLIFKRRPE